MGKTTASTVDINNITGLNDAVTTAGVDVADFVARTVDNAKVGSALTAQQREDALVKVNGIQGSADIINGKLGKVSEGAGYKPVYEGVDGTTLNRTHQTATSIEYNGYEQPILLKKSLTPINTFYFIFYIKLTYSNLLDLDKKFFLDLKFLEGLAPNVFKISIKNGAWSPSDKTIDTTFSELNNGVNIYQKIINDGRYVADFEAQTTVSIYIAHNSNATTVDGNIASWSINPYFEGVKKVIATELTDSLKQELNLRVSEGAGYIPFVKDENYVAYLRGGSNVSYTIEDESIILSKPSGLAVSYVMGLYLKIDYTNLADLDRIVHFDFEILSGLDMSTLYILGSVGDWNPSNLPVAITDRATCRLGGSGINIYNLITNHGLYTSSYEAKNTLYVAFSYYTGSYTEIDASNTVWRVTPYFEGVKRVVATELTTTAKTNLKNELIYGDEEIVHWGDSLTAGGGWTTVLAQLAGYNSFNAGTGGENSRTICARAGGDAMMVNNITIPADTTTSVLIADRDVDGGISTYFGNKVTPLLQGGTSHVNPVMIGDIEGTLSWTGSSYSDTTGNWEFKRSTAGTEVVIDRPTAITTYADRNKNGGVQVIFIGQNGGYSDLDDLVLQHKRMIEHSTASKTIIIGLSSGSATQRADYEARMKLEFGRYFISLREYLATPIYDVDGTTIISCYGVRDSDTLTGTALESNLSQSDLDLIATGTVPLCLLSDSVHYTTTTKTVIGTMVYKKAKELGIFK